MYERAIARAMNTQNPEDIETATDLQAMHASVCYLMHCPIKAKYGKCGALLDSRKSVYLTHPTGSFVMCGKCFDTLKQSKLYSQWLETGKVVRVTDSRLYKTDGTLIPEKPILPKATIVLEDYNFKEVGYIKKFKFEGEVFFIHGDRGDWNLSHWSTGARMCWSASKSRLVKEFKAMTREKYPDNWQRFDEMKQSTLDKVGIVND